MHLSSNDDMSESILSFIKLAAINIFGLLDNYESGVSVEGVNDEHDARVESVRSAMFEFA